MANLAPEDHRCHPWRFRAMNSHNVLWSLPAASSGRRNTGDTPVPPRRPPVQHCFYEAVAHVGAICGLCPSAVGKNKNWATRKGLASQAATAGRKPKQSLAPCPPSNASMCRPEACRSSAEIASACATECSPQIAVSCVGREPPQVSSMPIRDS